MFIEQGIQIQNKFWKYLVGSVAVVVASSIGQVPLMMAVMLKAHLTGVDMPEDQSSIMSFLDSNLTLFFILISFVFAIVALGFIIKYLHQQTLISVLTSRQKLDWRRIAFSFALWTSVTVVSTIIMYLLKPADFEVNFNPIAFLFLLLVAVPLMPLQTSCEELLFRGYLMQGFANLAGNKWFPLLMTSCIFGAMHFFNPEVGKMGNIIMIYYIGTGFFLGIMTLMDEGLELSLGFHAANNLVGALLVTTDWTVFQTASILKDRSEPSAGVEIILPVFIIYPLILYVFSKKYHWQNWKEKLAEKIDIEPN